MNRHIRTLMIFQFLNDCTNKRSLQIIFLFSYFRFYLSLTFRDLLGVKTKKKEETKKKKKKKKIQISRVPRKWLTEIRINFSKEIETRLFVCKINVEIGNSRRLLHSFSYFVNDRFLKDTRSQRNR